MKISEKIALKQLKFMKKNSSNMRLAAEKWKAPFQTLISTILSARTRDEMTIPVADKLFTKYPTILKLSKAKLNDIKKIIKPINFYKNKSKYILACAKALVKDHKGKVPRSIDELIKLSGVGRKTANVFLSEHGDPAIPVDTHVHYISNYLGWSNHKNPHKVEEDLKNLFSKKNWGKVNSTLVRFGKTHTSRRKKDELLEEVKRMK